jgi:hypothetical protein
VTQKPKETCQSTCRGAEKSPAATKNPNWREMAFFLPKLFLPTMRKIVLVIEENF